jgi:L-2-hydroxycarboxylate dehydrogenase (NAD+)
MDKQIIIPVPVLRNFAVDVFIAIGVPHEESNIRGIESHGMSRLKMYIDRIVDGRQKAVTKITIERDTPSTALIDGHDGMGAVI